eukprot:TRINITY_DN33685_c0_g1_i2.p1 TRINITY_DN33685_c0_g1~~TRINITY_DN33685_c0_g1_i2.p1  ORF type:complete len:1011 (+),score=375.24 TRINITY_DN33685_c0_g1_i2:51-3083(+)
MIFSPALAALAVVCLVGGVSAEHTKKRWVLLEVHGDMGVQVVRDRFVFDGSVTVTDEGVHTANAMFSVRHHAGEVHFRDPRHMHHEHMDPHTGDWNGSRVQHARGYVHVVVPHDSHIDLQEHPHNAWGIGPRRATRKHQFSMSRTSDALADEFTFKPELITYQSVADVDDTYNIVFLAGCYAKTSRAKFDADLKKAVSFLTGFKRDISVSGGPLSAQPVNRYFNHFNIFAIWDESPRDGANHPNANGDVADPHPNRLQCSYGTTIKRMLSCNFAEVRALASYAPSPKKRSSQLVLTLVNDQEYGGAGGGGIAALYTGDGFEKVMIHEMGHAAADLSDEYDYGFNETQDLQLTNCAKNPGNLPSGWKHYQQQWAKEGKPTQPYPVCSYTNYYRPTASNKGDDTCLMQSSGRPKMCDVCREGMIENGIYQGGGSIDLSVPRCPLAQEKLIVQKTSYGVLHLNSMLQDAYMYGQQAAHWGPKFNIQWNCKSVPAGSGIPCATIRNGDSNMTSLTVGGVCAAGSPGADTCAWPGPSAAEGEYSIDAIVTDTAVATGWTRATHTSTATFRFVVTSDLTAYPCTEYDCNTRYGRGTGDECAKKTTEDACSGLNCHWDKIDGKCYRFFGGKFSGTQGYKICTQCDDASQKGCALNFSTQPRPAESFSETSGGGDNNPVDVNAITEQLGAGKYAMFIAAGCMGMGMLFALYKTCAQTTSAETSEARYTPCNQALRQVILILFTALVWASVFVVGLGVFLFLQTEMEIWGSAVVIIVIITGVLLFVLTFYVFGSVAKRSKCQLIVGIVLLLIATAFALSATIIVQRMADHASDGADRVEGDHAEWESITFPSIGVNWNWMDSLRELWLELTEKKPDVICKFQSELKCSGFQKACYNVKNSYCPTGSKLCDDSNMYANPCMRTLQKKLADNFEVASIVSTAITACLALGLLMVIWLTASLFCCAEASRPSKNTMSTDGGYQKHNDHGSPNFGQQPQVRPHPMRPHHAQPYQHHQVEMGRV